MNDIAKKLLLSVVAVLLLLGTVVSPANAERLRCLPPSTPYRVTVFPGDEASLPGTTLEWQVRVDEGVGEYRYEEGYDIGTIGEIGSITSEGKHLFKYSGLTKVNVVNKGDTPLKIKACYVLVE